ncbi:MAG: GyrI-like domain-containing protein [Alphaproteobacteria bacterium]|nr:GyrI-like domain-containing protein [Alphaproteobacteria bacterium]
MKGLVQILIAVVAIVVVALGVGYFVLPKEAKVERSVQIPRPVTSVYAMLASTPAGSPFAAGTQTVTAEGADKPVKAVIALDEKTSIDATYTLAKSGDGVKVTLAAVTPLGSSPIARIQGALGGGATGKVLETGLQALATAAEKLPAADFGALKFEVVDVAAKPFLYLDAETPNDATSIKEGVSQATKIIQTMISANGLKPDGSPIAVETKWDDAAKKYAFLAGQPYTGPAPKLLIGVKSGQTPSGTAVKVLYEGPEDQVLPIYDQIEAAIAASRGEKAGPSFEVYLDDPTQAGGSVKRHIYQIVKGDLTTLRALSSPGATMTPAAPAAPAAAPAEPAPAAPAAPAPAAPAPATTTP